jgi:hypothetical protein
MASWTYFKERVTAASTFLGFSAFVSTAVGLDYVWGTYFQQDRGTAPLVWGLTVTLGLFLFFGLLNYCWYAQSVLQSEIDRITDVKARLESQMLKKRLSSKKQRR